MPNRGSVHNNAGCMIELLKRIISPLQDGDVLCILCTMSLASSGKLLVALLLVLCSGRVFFIRRGLARRVTETNSLSVLSALSLAVSVLQIASNGADAVSLSLVVIALFSFITNVHAMSRLLGSLFIDHYGVLFFVLSAVSFACSVFLCLVIVYFASTTITPREMKKLGVVEQKVRYAGSFLEGFTEAKPFSKASADVYIFKPDFTPQGQQKVVILATDKRAGIEGYTSYMAFLASHGIVAMAGDFAEGKWLPYPFGARPFRRFAILLTWLDERRFQDKQSEAGKIDDTNATFKKSILNKLIGRRLGSAYQFYRQHEFFTFAEMNEVKAMKDIAEARFGGQEVPPKIGFISDEMSSVAVESAAAEAMKEGEYITVYPLEKVLKIAGLGFVQQADPLLAWYLGLPRDRTLNAQKMAADETAALLKEDYGGKK